MLTTDILHESWLKLRSSARWSDENHFFSSVAQAMRHVLIDHARRRLAGKRAHDGECSVDELSDYLPEFREQPEQLVAIAEMMEGLRNINGRYSNILDLRYFGGFTEQETADILGKSSRTIRRDWVFIKAWLASALLNQSEE
ncbi:hypothetical protein NBRC116583_26020 [Arenicella sp. 4NH20-0111]